MNAVVELEDAVLRRGGREILRAARLRVGPGEHWALLGPNGAGKSTILALCGATAHPTSGVVHVLGARIGRVELQALRRRIGHVNPRHPLTSDLTVREVVLTGITGTIEVPLRWAPTREEVERADEVIGMLGLAGKEGFAWTHLSQGERGRALIARALLPDPQLLLLDEPATGLDLASREVLLEVLEDLSRERPGITSILVTHHLEELPRTTTHVALVSDGEIIAAGPVSEVLTSAHVSAAFGLPISVEWRDGRWSARTLRRA